MWLAKIPQIINDLCMCVAVLGFDPSHITHCQTGSTRGPCRSHSSHSGSMLLQNLAKSRANFPASAAGTPGPGRENMARVTGALRVNRVQLEEQLEEQHLNTINSLTLSFTLAKAKCRVLRTSGESRLSEMRRSGTGAARPAARSQRRA